MHFVHSLIAAQPFGVAVGLFQLLVRGAKNTRGNAFAGLQFERQQTLDEERATDEKLTELATSEINAEAEVSSEKH